MSFVKSILQQWRDRNLKKNTYSDSEQLIVSDIPGTDIAEQHLLEALARQINDAVNNGKTISSLNVEIVYEQLAESLDRFKQESLNTARNELSEKWREEESRRIAEIKNLQEQNAELSHNYTEAQKRHAGAERTELSCEIARALDCRTSCPERVYADFVHESQRDGTVLQCRSACFENR